jgi:hypothetical protein
MKIDLEQMLNKELQYAPKEIKDIEPINTFDKLKDRYTSTTDGLNVLPLLKVTAITAVG